MFRRIIRYEENCMGLPYPVILLDAAEEHLDTDGSRIGISIPDIEGLAASIAVARCLDPVVLSGEEVRFLRRVLGYTQKDLADRLEVKAAEVISRWENGAQQSGGYTEKLLRALAVIQLRNNAPAHADDYRGIVDLRLSARIDGTWPEMVARRIAIRGSQPDAWSTAVLHRWHPGSGGTVATEEVAVDSR